LSQECDTTPLNATIWITVNQGANAFERSPLFLDFGRVSVLDVHIGGARFPPGFPQIGLLDFGRVSRCSHRGPVFPLFLPFSPRLGCVR
jgi:hypothetical protein